MAGAGLDHFYLKIVGKKITKRSYLEGNLISDPIFKWLKNIQKPDSNCVCKMTVQIADCLVLNGHYFYFDNVLMHI